jgi:hypothetical protein
MPASVLQFFIALAILIAISSCANQPGDASASEPAKTPAAETPQSALFTLKSPSETGVDFTNLISEDYTYNIITYEYLYNGGGVAIGDIDGDGLPDLYFTSTFQSNKLYRNLGNLKFEDITDQAGVAAEEGFKTGVAMADVNGDGLLDIYVCRTGKGDPRDRQNLLFVNNGDLTFTEKAEAFGLVETNTSNHATFFDYDLDGDLDLYLLAHRLDFTDSGDMRLKQDENGAYTRILTPKEPDQSDMLFRNDNGRFVNVSSTAGIINSTFGLSATVADMNQDGYPDVYVANDYIDPDFVYINNGDGTFTDKYFEYLGHSSQSSMGSDIGDYNNDGLYDIIVMDMFPADPVRFKEMMNPMALQRQEMLRKYGYGDQVGRNVLQLNMGNGQFAEIGELAGVSTTDWSWGSLFADLDNDGWQDLHVANGYRRDMTHMDYVVYTRDSIERTGGLSKKRFPDINAFLDLVPEKKLASFVFRNQQDLTFKDVTNEWGMDQPAFSNGSAWADLDNDGDLDMVINNILDPAFIFENHASERLDHHYLQISLEGKSANTYGIGAEVCVTTSDGQRQCQAMRPIRGFFSSSQPIIHFGLGTRTAIEELVVVWPDRRMQTLKNVKADSRLVLRQKEADGRAPNSGDPAANSGRLFEALPNRAGIDFVHQENEYLDFNFEKLIPHRFSIYGPALAVADVNGDKLEDVYVGGARGQAGVLYIQTGSGRFVRSESRIFKESSGFEDVDAEFFDADSDGDMDLYVASGGNSEPANSPAYQDRLYLNDGAGRFTASGGLPRFPEPTRCVEAHDIDGDGDADLVVGGGVVPRSYPLASPSRVLVNEGGQFRDMTASIAPFLSQAGLIADVSFVQLDGEGGEELVIAGEWTPVRVFGFSDGAYREITEALGLSDTEGWWSSLSSADLDGDGDMDLIAGNHGLNTRLKASPESPLTLYAADFDQNGAIDPVLCYHKNGQDYPLSGRDMITSQMPNVKQKFPRYREFARASINDLFTEAQLKKADRYQARSLATSWFENQNGRLVARELPAEAQFAPVFDILLLDANADPRPDVLLVGNFRGMDSETGSIVASKGALLINAGSGTFEWEPNREHGLWADGEVRRVRIVRSAGGKQFVITANNNEPCGVFRMKPSSLPN